MKDRARLKRVKQYYALYEQIYKTPTVSLYDLAKTTKLSRNSVSKYLKEMYEYQIIRGPHLAMKSGSNYTEYVHLMKFTDPQKVFKGLRGFPHVVYYAMTFGDWNTMLVADQLLDFSQLIRFERIVYRGVKYKSYTPKVDYTTWSESFSKIYKHLQYTPGEEKNQVFTPLDWGDSEWKVYYAFKFDLRQKITPLLRKIGVRYESYRQWRETLHNHCTVHTGFYPEGYKTYTCYCFLLSTQYHSMVTSLFSLFPTTSYFAEMDDQLLVFVHVVSAEVKRDLFCLIYDLKTKGIIEGFKHAVVLFHGYHIETL